MRRVLRSVVLLGLTGATVPVAVAVVILASFLFLPLPAALPQPKDVVGSQTSKVLDANGAEIAEFREFEQNIPVKPEDIPDVLKQAVIASEDRSFYSHNGVDLRGTARALWSDVRTGKVVQGGSTITQQYVKNAYVGKERTVVRKVREAILATQLDRRYEKDTIIFRYLNSLYLGEGAYGVGAASETYFRKPVSQLTLSEAAVLAGVIPAPSRYTPRENPEGAETKRKIVLASMLGEGFITEAQHAEAVAQPIWLATQGPPPGPATIVHPAQQQVTKYPYFVDYVRRYLTAKYGPATVFRGGLRIQTTLDPAVQEAAEASVAASLKGIGSPIEMGMAAVEPPTGFVKALVGGRDFYNGPFAQVNLALGGCPKKPTDPKVQVEVQASCWSGGSVAGGGTGRQPGSSFKAFVLAAALAKGIAPTRVYPAPGEYRIPGCKTAKGCTIRNFEGKGGGPLDLRRATWASVNTVYAQLVNDVGVRETAEMAKKLGITSAWESPAVHGLSLALGTLDVSPLDMAGAYAVFANRGMRQQPVPVLKVVDTKGRVLEDNSKRAGERAIEEVVADNVTDILKGVITSGTGKGAAIGRPAAGKTGTAQAFRDAWFVGYTPTLSTAVWIGNGTGQITLNIRGRNITGGSIPASTWKTFMSKALVGVPVTDFSEPAPIKPLADALKKKERGEIDPGNRREPQPTPSGGTYFVRPQPPTAEPPPATTTTTSTTPPERPRPTTTTTQGFFGRPGDD